jgi:hypothetical protein
LPKWLVIALLSALAVLIGIVACFYLILWQPSLQGSCNRPEHRSISTLRGRVVGKFLGFVQYRWLRRRFNAAGTTLSLERNLPSTEYMGNEIRHVERVGEMVVDGSGSFDFGKLTPGEYVLSVTLPEEDTVSFHFDIAPSAHNKDVLIDASPAYYCSCCGWNFEAR